jgi:outer membrane protein assembly factor BamB
MSGKYGSGKHRTLVGTAILGGLIALAGLGVAEDWTQWRGPSRDGTVSEFKAPQAWPQNLKQMWKLDVGEGYATPVVVGNRIYMFSRRGGDEIMRALDAATGRVLWDNAYPAAFTMNGSAARHGPGPKSTPVYSNGKLYTIGMPGTVTAFDAATGKILWQKPGNPDHLPLYTSHSFSPVITGGLVIFHPGGHDKGALTAYDANTGDVKWSWEGDGPGYGSPLLVDIAGTRQIVTQTQTKLVGVEAATGTLLWEQPFASTNSTNSITPVQYGQSFIVSNNTLPTTAVSVSKENNRWIPRVAWENAEIPMRMTSGVIVGDVFFSMTIRNSGQYFTLDAKTGEILWRSEPRQADNAALLKLGDLVLSLEADGELILFRPGRTAFEEVKRYKVADEPTWTQPVIMGDGVLVKDVTTLAYWTWN